MGRHGRWSRTSAQRAVSTALALAVGILGALATGGAAGADGFASLRSARTAPADPSARAGIGAGGATTIRVAFDASGRGAFVAAGAVSDSGAGRASRSSKGQRLRLTETLTGSSGALVIRVEQKCGARASTWRVLRGSGGYAGITGGGRGTGGVPCKEPGVGFRGVYRGTVSAPSLQPPAVPGAYGGWTAQNERVTFDVLPGGRSVGNIRVERLHATCTPPLDVVVEPAFLSTYPIAPDGSFTAGFGNATMHGRLAGASAAGTLTYASSSPPYACTSGAVSWSASSPAPAPPKALPGTYCGSTAQGLGSCLRLSPDGRVTYLRVEARVDCRFQGETAQFVIETGFGAGSVPLRSNLSFEVLGAVEGDAGGEYVLRGTFDAAGRVTGTLSLHRTTFDDQEGRIYVCKDASSGWTAARVP